MNNAGTALDSPLRETTQEQFGMVFAVHVRGPSFVRQAPEPLLRDGGRIVNTSSALTRMTFARSGPYASAKGALEVLTRHQALEYGDRGMTADTIAVGAVPTDFGRAHPPNSPELQRRMADSAALRRLAAPQDIDVAIAGLATASGTWITGQRIEASGGVRL